MERKANLFAHNSWIPPQFMGPGQFLWRDNLWAATAEDPRNTTRRDDGEDFTPAYYQQTPTMFFVIAGLASMMFLILVAVALLCYSHYLNHTDQQPPQHRSPSPLTGDPFSGGPPPVGSLSPWTSTSSPETPHHTTPVILVRHPGQRKPTCFAQLAPFPPFGVPASQLSLLCPDGDAGSDSPSSFRSCSPF
ncbi:uncharacterized protein [Physcomitrium patens]|nr:uncharacterized protein LOC112285359 [Physcomitrium patens]|eukprot:XP_024381872.1 uncharacterized protein LOC112285359 [Physcomitrella patens]